MSGAEREGGERDVERGEDKEGNEGYLGDGLRTHEDRLDVGREREEMNIMGYY